jgi:hypothetical protein
VTNRRRYTEADRIAAILAVRRNGGQIAPVCRALGIPHETVRGWVHGTRHGETPELIELLKGPISERIEAKLSLALDALTPEKFQGASAAQLTTCVGILVDKLRVLRDFKPPGEEPQDEQQQDETLSLNLKDLSDKALDAILRIAENDAASAADCEGEPVI